MYLIGRGSSYGGGIGVWFVYGGHNYLDFIEIDSFETAIQNDSAQFQQFGIAKMESCTNGVAANGNASLAFNVLSSASVTNIYTGSYIRSIRVNFDEQYWLATVKKAVLSGTFAIDSTGLKTVTISHGCSFTPEPEDIQATIVENTDVDDWWGYITKVKDITSTQLSVDVYVADDSATGGATAKVSVWIMRVP